MEKSIEDWCKEFSISKYSINEDGSVCVNDSVIIQGKGLSKIPLQFGIVMDSFDCSDNKLTSLEGSPIMIAGSFWCSNNLLTSLESATKLMIVDFYCCFNNLTSLKGCPDKIFGDLDCRGNKLITLDVGYKIDINGEFWCQDNPVYLEYSRYDSYKHYIRTFKLNQLV
jgi:hypothetical protein